MKHSEARLGSRLVLFVLADYAHDDGSKAFPMVETIAQKARMSRKAVQTALRRLESDGEILCTGQTKTGTNIYSILGVGAGEKSGDTGDGGAKKTPTRGVAASSRGVVSTPDPTDDPSKNPSDVEEVVRAAWGKVSPPLPAHRDAYFGKAKVKTSLRKALEVYSAEDVARAIASYATVLASPAYFWTHRWTFQEFLDRGLDKFVSEADPLANFLVAKNTDRQGLQQATPQYQLAQAETWIIETAWRLPLDEGEIVEMLGRRGVEGPDRAKLVAIWREKRDRLDDAT